MKKKYFNPEMDFIPLLTDIIVTSGPGPDPKEDPTLHQDETEIDVNGLLKVEQ